MSTDKPRPQCKGASKEALDKARASRPKIIDVETRRRMSFSQRARHPAKVKLPPELREAAEGIQEVASLFGKILDHALGIKEMDLDSFKPKKRK